MVGGKQFPRGGAEPVPERAGQVKTARVVQFRRRFLECQCVITHQPGGNMQRRFSPAGLREEWSLPRSLRRARPGGHSAVDQRLPALFSFFCRNFMALYWHTGENFKIFSFFTLVFSKNESIL